MNVGTHLAPSGTPLATGSQADKIKNWPASFGISRPAETRQVSATECWGEDFTRVYYADSIELAPTEGDASLCAY